MEPHAEDDAEREHIADQRTAPVADERKRDPGDREQLDGHADVLENMESDHRDNPCAYIGAERILELKRDLRQMVNEHEEQNDDGTCPDESEIFRDDGEDEIGVVFRHVHLTALIAFSEHFARTDRIQGGNQVIAA